MGMLFEDLQKALGAGKRAAMNEDLSPEAKAQATAAKDAFRELSAALVDGMQQSESAEPIARLNGEMDYAAENIGRFLDVLASAPVRDALTKVRAATKDLRVQLAKDEPTYSDLEKIGVPRRELELLSRLACYGAAALRGEVRYSEYDLERVRAGRGEMLAFRPIG